MNKSSHSSTPAPAGGPRVALIAGPTASGKSAAALALAERDGGTIINADASQVYAELRIVSARPSVQEEARVPHRLFGYRTGREPCTAAAWAEDAKAAIAATLAEGRLPILVGGTGLYFRVLLDGIAPVPAIDPAVREGVRALDAAAAAAALAIEDPAMAARLHANDRSRLQRALEVVRSTGRSLGGWQQDREGGIAGRYRFEVTVLDPPVAALYARCDARFAEMIAEGALGEVEQLLAAGLPEQAPVMTAIGVGPLVRHLRGEIDLGQAVAEAQQATRNYAKRQRTWFRNQRLVEHA